ncbi:hypothetical protein [Fangia hongkongensis]|uniref:hypothetical protein n=1 Tax=Fangia hongkongensis TaxID=270495 RepID=UPI00036DBE40|nr:hypothetical protein [Fangia hongkongensis]MBK2126221.1 hypothetical protein [Fangia hongkongensis]
MNNICKNKFIRLMKKTIFSMIPLALCSTAYSSSNFLQKFPIDSAHIKLSSETYNEGEVYMKDCKSYGYDDHHDIFDCERTFKMIANTIYSSGNTLKRDDYLPVRVLTYGPKNELITYAEIHPYNGETYYLLNPNTLLEDPDNNVNEPTMPPSSKISYPFPLKAGTIIITRGLTNEDDDIIGFTPYFDYHVRLEPKKTYLRSNRSFPLLADGSGFVSHMNDVNELITDGYAHQLIVNLLNVHDYNVADTDTYPDKLAATIEYIKLSDEYQKAHAKFVQAGCNETVTFVDQGPVDANCASLRQVSFNITRLDTQKILSFTQDDENEIPETPLARNTRSSCMKAVMPTVSTNGTMCVNDTTDTMGNYTPCVTASVKIALLNTCLASLSSLDLGKPDDEVMILNTSPHWSGNMSGSMSDAVKNRLEPEDKTYVRLSDGSPLFEFKLQWDGNAVIYIMQTGHARWGSGTFVNQEPWLPTLTLLNNGDLVVKDSNRDDDLVLYCADSGQIEDPQYTYALFLTNDGVLALKRLTIETNNVVVVNTTHIDDVNRRIEFQPGACS